MFTTAHHQPDPERLLTTEEVADMLRIPVRTLYSWRYSNLGPPSMRVGRHLRYRRDDLAQWLEWQLFGGEARPLWRPGKGDGA